jgi:hypothetical protein
MASTTIASQSFKTLAIHATNKNERASRRPIWPQPKTGSREGGHRTQRRVKNWYDDWTAKKDRLEVQRRKQLDFIKDSVKDIAGKEWDVLTSSCRGDSDDDGGSSSDEEGFEIENDLMDDAADEIAYKVPAADTKSRSDKLPHAQKDRKSK